MTTAPSPASILADNLVLTLGQVAVVLNLRVARGAKRGEPCKRQAHALVCAGQLRPVDPRQPVGRMTVSCAEVRRYLEAETVTTATTTPLSLVKEAS